MNIRNAECISFGMCMHAFFGRLTTRWAILLIIASLRGVFFLTEQPCSSVMDYFGPLKQVQSLLSGVGHWTNAFLFRPQSGMT